MCGLGDLRWRCSSCLDFPSTLSRQNWSPLSAWCTHLHPAALGVGCSWPPALFFSRDLPWIGNWEVMLCGSTVSCVNWGAPLKAGRTFAGLFLPQSGSGFRFQPQVLSLYSWTLPSPSLGDLLSSACSLPASVHLLMLVQVQVTCSHFYKSRYNNMA